MKNIWGNVSKFFESEEEKRKKIREEDEQARKAQEEEKKRIEESSKKRQEHVKDILHNNNLQLAIIKDESSETLKKAREELAKYVDEEELTLTYRVEAIYKKVFNFFLEQKEEHKDLFNRPEEDFKNERLADERELLVSEIKQKLANIINSGFRPLLAKTHPDKFPDKQETFTCLTNIKEDIMLKAIYRFSPMVFMVVFEGIWEDIGEELGLQLDIDRFKKSIKRRKEELEASEKRADQLEKEVEKYRKFFKKRDNIEAKIEEIKKELAKPTFLEKHFNFNRLESFWNFSRNKERNEVVNVLCFENLLQIPEARKILYSGNLPEDIRREIFANANNPKIENPYKLELSKKEITSTLISTLKYMLINSYKDDAKILREFINDLKLIYSKEALDDIILDVVLNVASYKDDPEANKTELDLINANQDFNLKFIILLRNLEFNARVPAIKKLLDKAEGFEQLQEKFSELLYFTEFLGKWKDLNEEKSNNNNQVIATKVTNESILTIFSSELVMEELGYLTKRLVAEYIGFEKPDNSKLALAMIELDRKIYKEEDCFSIKSNSGGSNTPGVVRYKNQTDFLELFSFKNVLTIPLFITTLYHKNVPANLRAMMFNTVDEDSFNTHRKLIKEAIIYLLCNSSEVGEETLLKFIKDIETMAMKLKKGSLNTQEELKLNTVLFMKALIDDIISDLKEVGDNIEQFYNKASSLAIEAEGKPTLAEVIKDKIVTITGLSNIYQSEIATILDSIEDNRESSKAEISSDDFVKLPKVSESENDNSFCGRINREREEEFNLCDLDIEATEPVRSPTRS